MRKREFLLRGPSGTVVKFASEAARETVIEAVEGEHKIRRRRATFFVGVSKTYDARFEKMTFSQQRMIIASQQAYMDLKRRGII